MADLVRRGQAAEARHEDLAGALPEATRPLLRQIAALQVPSTHIRLGSSAPRVRALPSC